ncbi:hypothetical protein [Sandaracinus amylolyticus]|uniref:hypothetical protein n=1 Tax=Sandaracinus amylolyticus TaxID=927083 RepID=UPI001F453E7B|nr:hypothetical protein [Sandaracinus amylolyticus]UJR83681.1 Hypothetical protein I5071_57500 [Sandaracinus amylolyticus]
MTFSGFCGAAAVLASTPWRPAWIAPLHNPVPVVAGLAAFVALSLVLVVGWARIRIDVDEKGARGVDSMFRAFSFEWTDVRAVRASPTVRCWVLELARGTVVRISFDMIDAPVFAALLLRHARRAATAAVRATLERATDAKL